MPALSSLFSNMPAARLTMSYLIHDRASLLPHMTVPTLLSLPLPIGPHLPTRPRIRAMVLDKDNTLCPPRTTKLHQAYLNKIDKIVESDEFSHSRSAVLIVSNTSGSDRDRLEYEDEAVELERYLGIPVLRLEDAAKKKPLCGDGIMRFFAEHGVTTDPREVVVVGDRLATDVLLAREMGAWSVWARLGWRNPETPGRDYRGFLSHVEDRLERLFRFAFGMKAPLPKTGGVGHVRGPEPTVGEPTVGVPASKGAED